MPTMTTKTKARIFQGLIFFIIFLITWFIANFFINANLEYRAGISGMIAAAVAGILTPKIKTIKSQSGPKVQLTSIFIKGARFFD